MEYKARAIFKYIYNLKTKLNGIYAFRGAIKDFITGFYYTDSSE